MKISLKQKLNDLIKEKGQISYNELEVLCHQWQYKIATAERVLRKSLSSDIERIMKENAIIGYKYKHSEVVKDFLKQWPSRTDTRLF